MLWFFDKLKDAMKQAMENARRPNSMSEEASEENLLTNPNSCIKMCLI